ncbi:hypothetical protein [Actinophytocola sp.]
MSLSVDVLQELEPTEVSLSDDCCWHSVVEGCQIWSLTVSTCHSCTNTG